MQDNGACFENRINKLVERIEIIENEHLKWQQLISDILASIKKQNEELTKDVVAIKNNEKMRWVKGLEELKNERY
jgi:uncharacterized protein (UPF0335 family)